MSVRVNGTDLDGIIRDVRFVADKQREHLRAAGHAEGTMSILVDVNHPIFEAARRIWKRELRRRRMSRKRRRGWA